MLLAAQPTTQLRQSGQPDRGWDRQQQAPIGEHGHGSIGRVDAVEHQRSDQTKIEPADSAWERDQPASWPMM